MEQDGRETIELVDKLRRGLFVAALFEVIRKNREVSKREQEEISRRMSKVLEGRNFKRWQDRLSAEEKTKHFVRMVGQGRQTKYDEHAYGEDALDLVHMLRNISAHMKPHGFVTEEELYEWVDVKWPWFWGAYVEGYQ